MALAFCERRHWVNSPSHGGRPAVESGFGWGAGVSAACTTALTSPGRVRSEGDVCLASKGVEVPAGVELDARHGERERGEERGEADEGEHGGGEQEQAWMNDLSSFIQNSRQSTDAVHAAAHNGTWSSRSHSRARRRRPGGQADTASNCAPDITTGTYAYILDNLLDLGRCRTVVSVFTVRA